MSRARAIPRRLWAPALVLLLVAGAISGELGGEQPLVQTRTSYGGLPDAWGAAHDLLRELGLPVTRSRARFAERDPKQTQWIIQPAWRERDLPHELASIDSYAKLGGTVVLIGADERVWQALSFARVAREPGRDQALREAGASLAAYGPEFEHVTLEGPPLRAPRRVELGSASLFDADNPGSEPRLGAGAGALVLERRVGAGRIVAVADSRFLTNERLGELQHAPLLVDLALAYGAPSFDERCHGLISPRSPWAALGPGFLLLAGAALLALAVAALQSARRWPPCAPAGELPPPPTLEVFVHSLASLYRARGRSAPAAVFRAYRAGYLRRVARALFGQREVSQAELEQRLEREAARLGPAGRWLAAEASPASPAELARAVSALERYAAAGPKAKRKR